jgi:hypothetical protein
MHKCQLTNVSKNTVLASKGHNEDRRLGRCSMGITLVTLFLISLPPIALATTVLLLKSYETSSERVKADLKRLF